jgi:hypothetical protein
MGSSWPSHRKRFGFRTREGEPVKTDETLEAICIRKVWFCKCVIDETKGQGEWPKTKIVECGPFETSFDDRPAMPDYDRASWFLDGWAEVHFLREMGLYGAYLKDYPRQGCDQHGRSDG